MRNKLILTVVLLALSAWAIAQQQGSSSPSAPPTSSSQASSPGASSSSSAQSGSQATSSAGSAQEMGEQGTVTTGCLGGAAPNFTLTSASGTVYKLDIPAAADTSKLAQHVGESVDVRGKVTNGSSSADSSAASPSASSSMPSQSAGAQPPAAGANTGASAAGAGSTGASSANQPTIQVNGIRQGSGTCPGSANAKPTPK